MKEEENQNQMSIDVELPAEVADGIYSNLVMIAHSSSEFVVDFVQLLPGLPKAKVRSRIVLTPQHAKRFLYALKENIDRYENANGEIVEPAGGGDKDIVMPYNLNSMGKA